MSEHVSSLAEVELTFRKAMACNACFTCQDSTLQRASVNIAQPRPIGDNYWTNDVRIVLILLNSGAGGGEHTTPDETFRDLLHAYANGSGSLAAVFRHQWDHMPNWGRGGARFGRLYLDDDDGYGLKLDEITTANLAWCAELCNRYKTMLERCFERHTLPLLRNLGPDAVLLAGNATYKFTSAIRKACPRVEVVPVMHYIPFNILSPEDRLKHVRDVRNELARIREAKRAARTSSGDLQPLQNWRHEGLPGDLSVSSMHRTHGDGMGQKPGLDC